MKRALTGAVFGGLLMFLVPQAASGSARPVTPTDHNAEHKDCAGQPEAAPEGEQAPPKEQRQGDREQNDDGSTLF
jgi:hypothetical protein